MLNRTVRIAAGCSVDVTLALHQMARYAKADYLIIDYMYEGSVATMAADLKRNPEGGFATDFASAELEQELARILASGARIVTNAGGLNPFGCAAAVRALADRLGLKPRIAVVHGDNIIDQAPALRAAGYRDMYTGEPLPETLIGANVYFGAKPIAAALGKGAEIVITGRVVDSALTLGPLIHEFGWEMSDHDRLGAGTLTGHLLECGAHPSGGIFTDWRDVDWTDTSFPLAECKADGTAVLTKAEESGGLVTIGTVSEQILYEIADPRRYFMADVTCDLSAVWLETIGENRVRVSGGKGLPPTDTYKVCAIAEDGWRGVMSGVVSGPASLEKAERTAQAIIERARKLLRERNKGDFQSATYELIGSGASNGARALPCDHREMVYRIVVDHDEKDAVELMLRVSAAAMASMAPGTAGALGRSVSPKLRQYSFLIEKEKAPVQITIDGVTETIDVPTGGGFNAATSPPLPPMPKARLDNATKLPLEKLAWVRSGDKGDLSNIGIIARKSEYAPYLSAALTEDAVKNWYAHVFPKDGSRKVQRYELPSLNAFNFVLHEALDGGVAASRRFDSMGKGMGQQIIDFPIPVPKELAARIAGDR